MDRWIYFNNLEDLSAACNKINENMNLPNSKMEHWITPENAIKNYYADEWIFLMPPLDIYPHALDNITYTVVSWDGIPASWIPVDN